MSRNFDLMAQLDIELRETTTPTQTAASRVVPAPVASAHSDDAFRGESLRLVQRIFLSANGSAPRQVIFCDVDGDGGSSSVCARISRTLAANSTQSVCVVDANVRSPRLSDIFAVNSITPFSGTKEPLPARCVKVGSNLWLAGPDILADDSRVLLPVGDLKRCFAELRKSFGYVLIDAPGANVCGDAQLLGQLADAAILVIEANKTHRLTARKAKESLEAAGVQLLGTVLDNRTFPVPATIYKRL